MHVLLGSYYKYGTYKCYRPDFLDRTVRIFETLGKFFSFSIFYLIENLKMLSYGTYKLKLTKKNQTVRIIGT